GGQGHPAATHHPSQPEPSPMGPQEPANGEEIGIERPCQGGPRIDGHEYGLGRGDVLAAAGRPPKPEPCHQALLPRIRRRTGPGRLGRQRRVGVTYWAESRIITAASTRKLITVFGQKRSRNGSMTAAMGTSLATPAPRRMSDLPPSGAMMLGWITPPPIVEP